MHSRRVSPTQFWALFLNRYRNAIGNLKTYECTPSYLLSDIVRELGVRIGKAPDYISITSLLKLPLPLKNNNLYPVRLGQGRSRGARFVICRASSGYRDEVFTASELLDREPDIILPFNPNIWDLLSRISGESLAASAALRTINLIYNANYVIPQYRSANSIFRFKVSPHSTSYEYSGQVEVDSVVFSGSNNSFVVEAKKLYRRDDGVFKFQIGFSMQTISEHLGIPVRGVIAVKMKIGVEDIIRVAF